MSPQSQQQTNTLIIGASISGLATAASLHRAGIECLVIEKQDRVGAPWRNHYDRLHLHTSKRFSNLPFKKFGRTIPRYPGRQQVLDYLDDYQQAFNINPLFHTEALTAKREGGYWITATTGGSFRSKYLVMATGPYGKPRPLAFTGVGTFPGRVLHSCEYQTGKDFKRQKVLVVGFGNSACEIAIDLYEQGAMPAMAVRSPVNVVPRDVLGVPVQELSLLLNPLPARVADAISAPLMKWLLGDLSRLGLRKMPYGPIEEMRRDGNAPVLDIGIIKLIRERHIKMYGDIDHIEGNTIHFKDGKEEAFDAIVAGIGYGRGFAEIVDIFDIDRRRFEDLRVSVGRQKYFGKDGLYFCGYWISPTGQIREIASDAKKIARHIAKIEQ